MRFCRRIHARRFFIVTYVAFLALLLPMSVLAIGLSPPEVAIEYLPVGTSYTVSATISRAPEELSGDLLITVQPRKSAASFFHGESNFTIPDGTREMTYLYNIIPEYATQAAQELYVTFLLQPAATIGGGVSVITGATQVVRFSTDVGSVPGAPTQVSAQGANAQTEISFSAPQSNGGRTVTSYTVTCTPSAGGASMSASAASSPVTVTGLTNGTAYSCSVTATNAIGTGLASDSVTVTPAATSVGGGVSRRSSEVDTEEEDDTQEAPADTTPSDDAQQDTDDSSTTQTAPQTDQEEHVDASEESLLDWLLDLVTPSQEGDTTTVTERESLSFDQGESGQDTFADTDSSDSSECLAALMLEVQSSTHPSTEQYYRGEFISFSWGQPGPGDATVYRFVLNQQEQTTASDLVFETQTPSITYEMLSDGVYYFHIADTSSDDCEIVTRRFMVDNTPPTIALDVINNPPWFFLFSSSRSIRLDVNDALAGVSQVKANLSDRVLEVRNSQVSLRGLDFGDHVLTVQAVDEAGNEVVREFLVHIEPRYPITETLRQLAAPIESIIQAPVRIFQQLRNLIFFL